MRPLGSTTNGSEKVFQFLSAPVGRPVLGFEGAGYCRRRSIPLGLIADVMEAPNVLGQIRIDHWCESLELAPEISRLSQVDVGEPLDQLHSAQSAGKSRPLFEGALPFSYFTDFTRH